MTAESKVLTNPEQIAEEGERIYRERYQAAFTAEHNGQFAVIDVRSGQAFVSPQPEKALQEGRQAIPSGLFHLIRIGAPGAFRVSYSSHVGNSWLAR